MVCRERLCPCTAERPELCEVEVEDGDCRCRVALAAAQDGICEPGEQLLVSPKGQKARIEGGLNLVNVFLSLGSNY